MVGGTIPHTVDPRLYTYQEGADYKELHVHSSLLWTLGVMGLGF